MTREGSWAFAFFILFLGSLNKFKFGNFQFAWEWLNNKKSTFLAKRNNKTLEKEPKDEGKAVRKGNEKYVWEHGQIGILCSPRRLKLISFWKVYIFVWEIGEPTLPSSTMLSNEEKCLKNVSEGNIFVCEIFPLSSAALKKLDLFSPTK